MKGTLAILSSLAFIQFWSPLVHAETKLQIEPLTIKLTSRVAPRGGAISRKRAALSSVTVPLEDWFRGTDLQWFGNISIGTPPQVVPVIFDTGSDALEVTSSLCGTPCDNQVKYDPAKSSTFVDGGDDSVQTLPFATGVGVDPVIDNNYELTVRGAHDTITVGGMVTKNTEFYIITNQTAKFAIDPFSGIQGMGTFPQGFFGALIDQGLPALFSFYLTPNAVGQAELTIGGIDDTKYKGPLIYTPLPAIDGNWELTSTQISINGVSTPFLSINRTFVFDSGTSNLVLPPDITEAIYALISPDIKPFPAEPGTYGLPCDKIKDLRADLDWTFTSDDGKPFNLTIPSSELSVGPFESDPSVCQTLINALEGVVFLGGSLMKHYYIVHDIGNARMGFAPNGF